LEISPPEWRATAHDEEMRMADASQGWSDFLGKLDAAIEQHQRGAKDPEEDWDEYDYERFLRESDARTDKYGELLDKHGVSDEGQERIDYEMGWSPEMSEDAAEQERHGLEEINASCEPSLDEPLPLPDPLREGIDWVRLRDGDIRHPLQHRCFESVVRLCQQCKDLGLDVNKEDLGQFLFQFQTTGAKLAGALGSVAQGHGLQDPAFTVAWLKRALHHLHKAQGSLEVAVQTLRGSDPDTPALPEALIAEARQELFEIREGILRLMQEYRERS
jgi:hypothetical protein